MVIDLFGLGLKGLAHRPLQGQGQAHAAHRNRRCESGRGHAARAGGGGAGRAARRERGRGGRGRGPSRTRDAQRAERTGDAGEVGVGEAQSERADGPPISSITGLNYLMVQFLFLNP